MRQYRIVRGPEQEDVNDVPADRFATVGDHEHWYFEVFEERLRDEELEQLIERGPKAIRKF